MKPVQNSHLTLEVPVKSSLLNGNDLLDSSVCLSPHCYGFMSALPVHSVEHLARCPKCTQYGCVAWRRFFVTFRRRCQRVFGTADPSYSVRPILRRRSHQPTPLNSETRPRCRRPRTHTRGRCRTAEHWGLCWRPAAGHRCTHSPPSRQLPYLTVHTTTSAYQLVRWWLRGRVPDLQSGGCRFESLLHQGLLSLPSLRGR